ncbi:MAG: hypothetical protein PHP59_01790 [Methanofollis sp.]|uniref:hypothetical protein n=1 Tax=Methanofollis sp. TaxID=2052835 RepID=UPI00261A05AE|nr:hypothetical protein [Methanofollis sp.]MDD4254086.1 hypothetical protein [Methanofollis sp.]
MSFSERLPVIYALAAAALFGITAPFSKLLLDGVGPVTMASLLFPGSGNGLLIYLAAGSLSGNGREGVERRRSAVQTSPGSLEWSSPLAASLRPSC